MINCFVNLNTDLLTISYIFFYSPPYFLLSPLPVCPVPFPFREAEDECLIPSHCLAFFEWILSQIHIRQLQRPLLFFYISFYFIYLLLYFISLYLPTSIFHFTLSTYFYISVHFIHLPRCILLDILLFLHCCFFIVCQRMKNKTNMNSIDSFALNT